MKVTRVLPVKNVSVIHSVYKSLLSFSFFFRFVWFSVRNSNAGVEQLLSQSCTVEMIIK